MFLSDLVKISTLSPQNLVFLNSDAIYDVNAQYAQYKTVSDPPTMHLQLMMTSSPWTGRQATWPWVPNKHRSKTKGLKDDTVSVTASTPRPKKASPKARRYLPCLLSVRFLWQNSQISQCSVKFSDIETGFPVSTVKYLGARIKDLNNRILNVTLMIDVVYSAQRLEFVRVCWRKVYGCSWTRPSSKIKVHECSFVVIRKSVNNGLDSTLENGELKQALMTISFSKIRGVIDVLLNCAAQKEVHGVEAATSPHSYIRHEASPGIDVIEPPSLYPHGIALFNLAVYNEDSYLLNTTPYKRNKKKGALITYWQHLPCNSMPL
ncbi:unnamed protein product [Lepeophtheirus salmonis]|uniref:(salmon louse) hypothetical protein n=1 Tax=Lepeophtheirus salmonis TaxID=72036 RepID=A0A7R8CZ27_LEPSM|nr:unnamed protein product [Lepeophtheirus salmonis]CAF2972371.1 unnamed protein product [Lepeophtheirus salmonis]